MNPLLKRLASLRLKVRLLDGWQGICAVIALIVGVGVTVGLVDYWAHLPHLFRAGALVGLLVGSGCVAFYYLLRPFSRSCDDLSLALRVEEVYPELNDSLASTVQFLKQSAEDAVRVGGSPALRERTVRETTAKAAACDFGRILDRRGAILFSVAACGILLAAGLVVNVNRQHARTAFWRFVEPFGPHTWTRVAVLRQDEDKNWEEVGADPKVKDLIAVGRPYFLKVNLQGQIPKHAKIEIEGQLIRSDKLIELKPSADKQSASFETSVNMTSQYQKFKFRILANDGAFPPRGWHDVEVLLPPKLIDLAGKPSPQITLHPPAYTDLPATIKLAAGVRHLEVIAGTNVVLRAKADRPLEQAWVEYHPENALFPNLTALSFLGQTNPLAAVAQTAMGSAVWGRVHAKFEQDGSVLEITFMPWVSGTYVLHLRDKYRLVHQLPADVRVQLDPVPEVKLVKPGSSVTAHPDAELAFKFRVTDETFAIRSVFVEYRKKAPDGRWLDDLKRVVLYDAAKQGHALAQPSVYGKMLPQLLVELGRAPTKDLRLRYKQLDLETVWSLRNEGFQEGDLVVIEICADDFCDIYGTREAGRSHAVELRIISRSRLVQEAAQKVADIEKQIKLLEKMQTDALKATKETQSKDKIERKDKENFIDKDEQVQKQIQDMIGRAADEGLRRELAEIRDQLRLNKLQGTQVSRDAGKIKAVLDSIAQQELPQLEPKLADIRNELPENDKNTPKTKKDLEEAGKLQNNVRKALSELNKELDPSARMQEHSDKLRNLIEAQRNLQKELDGMRDDKKSQEANAQKNPNGKKAIADEMKTIQDDFKTKVGKKADEQRELYQQTQKLIAELKAAKDSTTDPDNAKKIEEALKVMEPKAKEDKQPKQPEDKQSKEPKTKEPVTKQMNDVFKELGGEKKDKSEAPPQALEKQENIAQQLEKALERMEGRNEEVTKSEIQKRKDAEKQIDKLDQKLKRLQAETKKADKIEDMAERLKKKQELAEKHAELQEEIQEMRRQLARLEEPRAANALNDADNKLGKAKGKLEQGGDPQQDQQQAREDLQQAKNDLREAEEELNRELLVKIADQLEGLKNRQATAVERSDKLQAKIMKKKEWTDPLITTIELNIDAQKGIGEETDSLTEKLKDAKVFHNILQRAKEEMDKASEEMTARRKGPNVTERAEGEMMDADQLVKETEAHDDTIRHQKQAAKKLENLLDALKQEIAKKPKKPKDDVAKKDNDPPEKKEEQKGGLKTGGGIPPMAQLKALRSEQLDLNQRTEDFAKRNPDTANLNERQANELLELTTEQDRLRDLFGDITAPPEPKEGGQP